MVKIPGTRLARWIVLCLTFLLFIASNHVGNAKGPDVLVAGYYLKNHDEPMPCYWRNGRLVMLTIGGNQAGRANCIGMAGGTIYVGGYFKDSTGIEKPCYWENGVFKPLPLIVPSKNGQVRSVAFYNNEPYFGGYCFNQSMSTDRCYWKNAELIQWANSSLETESSVYAITIDHGDIYLCGYYVDPMGATSISYYYPCYWKNKTLYTLPTLNNEFQNAWVTSMAPSEKGMIFAGYLHTFSTPPIPCYWRDNQNIALSVLDPDMGGWTSAIAVSESNIFIVGHCKTKFGVAKPCVWKNGSIRVLPTINPQRDGFAKSVVAMGTDVYIAGYCRDKFNKPNACYWKNGQRIDLSGPSREDDTAANSIFVGDAQPR